MSGRHYWDHDTDRHAIRFVEATAVAERNRIWTKHIHVPASAMADGVITKRIRNGSVDREVLSADAVSHLFEKLTNFDPGKGTRPFSYATAVIFNFVTKSSERAVKDSRRSRQLDSRLFQEPLEVEGRTIMDALYPAMEMVCADIEGEMSFVLERTLAVISGSSDFIDRHADGDAFTLGLRRAFLDEVCGGDRSLAHRARGVAAYVVAAFADDGEEFDGEEHRDALLRIANGHTSMSPTVGVTDRYREIRYDDQV